MTLVKSMEKLVTVVVSVVVSQVLCLDLIGKTCFWLATLKYMPQVQIHWRLHYVSCLRKSCSVNNYETFKKHRSVCDLKVFFELLVYSVLFSF